MALKEGKVFAGACEVDYKRNKEGGQNRVAVRARDLTQLGRAEDLRGERSDMRPRKNRVMIRLALLITPRRPDNVFEGKWELHPKFGKTKEGGTRKKKCDLSAVAATTSRRNKGRQKKTGSPIPRGGGEPKTPRKQKKSNVF